MFFTKRKANYPLKIEPIIEMKLLLDAHIF
jgi:hypothetical protein